MGGIDGYRREQRLGSFGVKVFGVGAGRGTQRAHGDDLYQLRKKRRNELFTPAIVLSFYKFVRSDGEFGEHFARFAAIGAGVLDTVFHLLQKTSDTDFHEFVKIAGGDGQEFRSSSGFFESRASSRTRSLNCSQEKWRFKNKLGSASLLRDILSSRIGYQDIGRILLGCYGGRIGAGFQQRERFDQRLKYPFSLNFSF